jgi:hypothetical protein
LSLSPSPPLFCGIPPDEVALDDVALDDVALDDAEDAGAAGCELVEEVELVEELEELEPHPATTRTMSTNPPAASRLIDPVVALNIARPSVCAFVVIRA